MAGHEPPDVRPLPRRRDHQPVRGLRRPRRTRLGRLPREVREHPAARPDPACGGRRPQPIQDRQAGRHGDALLPLHARGTTRDLRAAGVRLPPRHGRADHRVLRPADVARLDAELCHLRGSTRRPRPGELVGPVSRRAPQRCRRYPGRHHERRDPPGCHGRDTRRRAAVLRGHPHPRQRSVPRPPAPERAR